MPSPITTIKQFIESFDDSKELKKFVEVLMDTAFSSPIADEWTASFRTDLIFYRQQILLLIDSVFIVGKPIVDLFEIFHLSNNEKN